MRKIIFTLVFIAAVISANAQFTITPVKGVAGTYSKHFSFPAVRSDNSRVAAKIDSLLQLQVLGNEEIVKDEKKIFNNTVYYEEQDSTRKTGFDLIEYEILLNNARVLSIKFNLEATAAYSENYFRYFCFDAQTGELLSEKPLFTPGGLKYLQTYLRSVRAKRIKEFLKVENANIEDSAFARATYEECNSEAAVNLFVIRKQNIFFYKENCFPHAWRPLDTDLDVSIDYRVIKKYLTPRGRKLLGL